MNLYRSERGLTLSCDGMIMEADLSHMKSRVRKDKLTHEMLIKAVKSRQMQELTVWDATAGMGEDAMLMAGAGYQVVLFENNPVIAALLKDALRKASVIPELKEAVSQMYVVEGDSIQAMENIKGDRPAEEPMCFEEGTSQKKASFIWRTPDVVYLDPMFPERQKSGLVKKKFQLLHHLEQPCQEEEALLSAALHSGAKKIVIKRPLKGPWLADVKPSYSIKGKSIRYDCIVL